MPGYTVEPASQCSECGGPLVSGPFGLRCARCVLSLVSEPENGGAARVAELFPELHLERQVARGGFGAVFRAEHRRMRRPVALKFLDTVLARSPEAVALFEQEMITVGGLDYPGIVRAHDAGERDGQWYIIMEFVDGEDCGALVRKHGALPIAESCEIIRQAALALHHAHGKGLVHRDVKPGNIMVSAGGTEGSRRTDDVPQVLSVPLDSSTVKILDFGLAGLAVAPVFGAPVTTGGTTLFLGTLEYTAPEQIEDPATVDARADIYSLGATLYRLLTGKTTHPGNAEVSLFVQMKRITSESVPSIATVRPDLPKPLVLLCDRMLAIDREKRPASAAEVARLIEPWCAGAELPRLFTDGPLPEKPFVFPKIPRRHVRAAAAVALLASLAALGAWIYKAGQSAAPPVPAIAKESWRPVFNEHLNALRQLDENSRPRLFSDDWDPESETASNDYLISARFLPDGRIAYLNSESDNFSLRAQIAGEPVANATILFREKDPGTNIRTMAIAPDGHIAWAHQRDGTALHIRRARPDGTALASLRYDFPADLSIPSFAYEIGRTASLKAGGTVFDGFPWGMAVVTEGSVPPNTGLQPGDALIADEGHMHVLPGRMSDPGLWKFRFDDDKFASRLGRLPPEGYNPVDVAVSRHGVFLLNRTNVGPVDPEEHPSNTHDRILRWDKDGFHPCLLDKPLYDPSGLAADPLSADLYAVQGWFIPSVSHSIQRVLRLRPTAPDHYAVEVIADRFGRLGACGIAFSADGKRLVLTDRGHRVIVVLKRKG